jgi:hypothetical protein
MYIDHRSVSCFGSRLRGGGGKKHVCLAGRLINTPARRIKKDRVYFNANAFQSKSVGRDDCCTAAHIWIEDYTFRQEAKRPTHYGDGFLGRMNTGNSALRRFCPSRPQMRKDSIRCPWSSDPTYFDIRLIVEPDAIALVPNQPPATSGQP